MTKNEFTRLMTIPTFHLACLAVPAVCSRCLGVFAQL